MAQDMIMTLYHGASSSFKVEGNRALYCTPNINEAKEYALGLDDLGNYNAESFIYAIDVHMDEAVEVEDFLEFDSMGYCGYDSMPEVAFNPESGWYCVKHPSGLRLIAHFKNEL